MFSIVRDRQKVWPYCTSCGCRLQIKRLITIEDAVYTLTHFGEFIDRDAKGHLCSKVNRVAFIADHLITEFIGV